MKRIEESRAHIAVIVGIVQEMPRRNRFGSSGMDNSTVPNVPGTMVLMSDLPVPSPMPSAGRSSAR